MTGQDAAAATRHIVLADGNKGVPITVTSANPINYHQAISAPDEAARVDIFGRLFTPGRGEAPWPVVIVVPGSLGVAPSHLAHAASLVAAGIAACVIDPFGARTVTSTVADQAQYSFAASAWDVLATARALRERDEIDSVRIGAQGHSRGGSAVMTAAAQKFVQGGGPTLAAVYAAYPWCGHQFVDPDIGPTKVRAVIGDLDEWCLPQQVQGAIHAMALRGGDATLRVFAGAHHSFDRDTPIELIEDAAVAPGAPTVYIDDDGAFIHPVTNDADPSLTDRELMIYGMKTGHGRKGARIGSADDQAEAFREDMLRFWRDALL